MQHAHGSFTIDVHPLSPAPAEQLARYSINKQFQGDLVGASKGEMFSGGDPGRDRPGMWPLKW